MAALDGQITEYGLYGQTPQSSDWSDDLKGFDPDIYLDLSTAQSAELTLHEQRSEVYPDEFSRVLSGQIAHHYVEDYYNRVHVFPSYLDLGMVLNQETRVLKAWNAFLSESKDLDDITLEDATGVTIDEPDSYPVTFAPMEERDYEVTVSTTGPPSISATINFQFAIYTVAALIEGSRVVLWRWIPREQYTEILEWMTEILKTRKGEQRIAMREAPRQIFSYRFLRPPEEIAEIKVVVDDWNHRKFGLPVWKEHTAGIDADAGDTAINFDTSYRDYREDGFACLWENADKAIAVRVSNVRTDGIDLEQALEQDWSGALIMPMREAVVPEGFEFTRGDTGRWIRFSAIFIVSDNVDLSADASYDEYRGYDVLTDGNIIIGNISERIHRPLEQIDNGQGPITIETKQDYSAFARTVGRYEKTLAGLWQWRQWLHARRGKQKAFWLPSWNRDLRLAKTIASTDTEIDIEHMSLTSHGQFPLDCMMRLNDGTVFYRRITSAVELSGGDEQIAIDSSLGQEVTAGDIDLWCFMDLIRLNTDRVEMNHRNPYTMQTNIPVMRVPE